MEEILASHVSHKAFSAEIAKRALANFLDELDPVKTYFLAGEIAPWTDPSDDTLNAIVEGYTEGHFAEFAAIHTLFCHAIERRNGMEERLASADLPPPGKASDLKDIPYAETEEALFQRLLQIRSLQEEAAEKLGPETKGRFVQLMQKRRVSREKELTEGGEAEQEQRMLGCVLKAVASSLDAHTNYFTPSEASQFLIQVEQRLFGIGVQLRDDLNGLTIVRILEGAPATNIIKKDDRIIAVDGEPIIGLDTTEAVELIRGQKGTKVQLTLVREEEKLDVTVVRDEIVLNETRFEYNLEPFGDGVIAHLALYAFYQDQTSSSASDLRTAIETIRAEHNLKGVILDLRNNMGGLMSQAVSVSGLFIKKGVVVSTKDCHDRIVHLRNFDPLVTWEGPLVVLTNKATVSAAEIVAQTLQEYGRAIIVGDETTFGKGSYQTITLETAHKNKVNPAGEYKVTRGLYYTVSGRSPQRHGAKADIVVPGLYSETEMGEAHAKYALEPGSIEPNFDDKLEDIHPLHRLKMKRIYLGDLQKPEDRYSAYLPQLKKNSTDRIGNNPNYQNFLKLLKKEETEEACGLADLQREEAVNIMKDLLFMKKAG